MKNVRKTIAWVCIFSTLFMGCYASSLIDPNGAERKKIDPDDIERVVTKDGTKWLFDTPPTVVRDTLFGEAKIEVGGNHETRQVSLPLSDLREVKVSEFSILWTSVAVLVPLCIAGTVALVVANQVKYAMKRSHPWTLRH